MRALQPSNEGGKKKRKEAAFVYLFDFYSATTCALVSLFCAKWFFTHRLSNLLELYV